MCVGRVETVFQDCVVPRVRVGKKTRGGIVAGQPAADQRPPQTERMGSSCVLIPVTIPNREQLNSIDQ